MSPGPNRDGGFYERLQALQGQIAALGVRIAVFGEEWREMIEQRLRSRRSQEQVERRGDLVNLVRVMPSGVTRQRLDGLRSPGDTDHRSAE